MLKKQEKLREECEKQMKRKLSEWRERNGRKGWAKTENERGRK